MLSYRRFFISCILILSASNVTAGQANEINITANKKAYFIANISVTNREAYYNEYASLAIPTLIAHEAKILVASWDPTATEGVWSGNLAIVLEFSSMDNALKWYHSEEYKLAKPFRIKNTAFSNVVMLDAFVPPIPTP